MIVREGVVRPTVMGEAGGGGVYGTQGRAFGRLHEAWPRPAPRPTMTAICPLPRSGSGGAALATHSKGHLEDSKEPAP